MEQQRYRIFLRAQFCLVFFALDRDFSARFGSGGDTLVPCGIFVAVTRRRDRNRWIFIGVHRFVFFQVQVAPLYFCHLPIRSDSHGRFCNGDAQKLGTPTVEKVFSGLSPHAPLLKYRRDLPSRVQAIVDRALQKDIPNRYRHASDMAQDLRDVFQVMPR